MLRADQSLEPSYLLLAPLPTVTLLGHRHVLAEELVIGGRAHCMHINVYNVVICHITVTQPIMCQFHKILMATGWGGGSAGKTIEQV